MPVQLIERFFRELDGAWRWPAPEKIRLRVIGSAALMLQTSYVRGTKDSDILETLALGPEVQKRLREIAGADSKLYDRLRMYVDIVSNGLPLLPQVPQCHAHPLVLQHFELEVLDVVDVVVSKLKRFSANDVSDISAMIDLEHVPHMRLVDRFRSALDLAIDFRADQVPLYIANLNRVERDFFGVDESSFELPGWVE
ncbi:MAG TPA: DUF6036 family nucleotidyltransferase [Polyangiales bacterium]|nr:DUF6036 family nucleotidyltransferase [Polyangiales bacterium]